MSDRTSPGGENADSDAPYATYQWEDGTEPGLRVVEAVADATGCDVTSLPTLHDAVDVDAMNAILTGADHRRVVLAFEYANRRVEIDSNGSVAVGS